MTWALALRLGRVSNLPTVWTNVLAATVLAAVPSAGVAVAAPLIALACSLAYVGGMFLNDAFDRAYDARVRPERPIPSGAISAAAVFAWGFGFLAAGAALLVVTAMGRGGAAWAAALAALGLAGLIVLYDAWHKENPLGPFLMGLCRVMVYVATAVALTDGVPAAVLGGAAVLLSYLMGLTYVARQENLSEPSHLWPLALLAAPFIVGIPLLFTSALLSLLWAAFLAWVVAAVSHLGWRRRLDIPRAVVSLIAGISLVDAVLIATHGAPGLALVAVAGFVLTWALQRWVPGT